MQPLANYSPEDVVVIAAGLELNGFMDGSFITISKDIPLFSTRESADGTASRVQRNSGIYTVTLSLMSTSPHNDVLSAIANIDTLTQMGKFPLIIKDLLGSSLFFSTTSWIESIPDAEFGTSITSREWQVKCSQATMHTGSNNNASSVLRDLANSVGGLIPTLIS